MSIDVQPILKYWGVGAEMLKRRNICLLGENVYNRQRFIDLERDGYFTAIVILANGIRSIIFYPNVLFCSIMRKVI